MHYRVYYSTFSFCIGGVPGLKRNFGGPALKYFICFLKGGLTQNAANAARRCARAHIQTWFCSWLSFERWNFFESLGCVVNPLGLQNKKNWTPRQKCCICVAFCCCWWICRGMWGPSRHLGSLTAANWVSFDFNVAYSLCWGYSLINTLKLKRVQFERLGGWRRPPGSHRRSSS